MFTPSAFLNHNTFYVYYIALRSWMLVQSALTVGGARWFKWPFFSHLQQGQKQKLTWKRCYAWCFVLGISDSFAYGIQTLQVSSYWTRWHIRRFLHRTHLWPALHQLITAVCVMSKQWREWPSHRLQVLSHCVDRILMVESWRWTVQFFDGLPWILLKFCVNMIWR